MRIVASLIAVELWTWLHRFGGPGLILLGIIDNSVIPIPGGVDIVLILLSSHRREWWLYYAFMALVGAVLGGYLTYGMAEKGSEEALERKFGKKRLQKVYDRFKKGGFVTVCVSAVLPPPFPMVMVLMVAGVLKYPAKRFLAALTVGRAARFFVLALLGRVYGSAILGVSQQYYKPLLYTLIVFGVVGGIAAFVYFKWYRTERKQSSRSAPQTSRHKARG